MTQLKPSTCNFVISGAADVFVAGNSKIVCNVTRSTMPLQESTWRLGSIETADPTLTDEFSESKREIESLWRARTKKTREAKPIPFQTLINAQDFLEKLSVHCPNSPEINSMPDGDVTFDWETDKGNLSVLIDERTVYFYAKSKNGKRRKGADTWERTIPREVLNLLSTLYSK